MYVVLLDYFPQGGKKPSETEKLTKTEKEKKEYRTEHRRISMLMLYVTVFICTV